MRAPHRSPFEGFIIEYTFTHFWLQKLCQRRGMLLWKVFVMKLKHMHDQQLVRKYISGEDASLVELHNRYKSKVLTSIVMLVKDQALAEDIFQDTFIRVVETLRRGNYKDEGKFVSWVNRIAHNLIIDHFRRERRSMFVSNVDGTEVFDFIGYTEDNAEVRLLKEQTYAELRRLIQRLPDEQKEVLIMRHYADMSFKEIADITEVSINTALGRMRYALSNLRKMMHLQDPILKTG